MAWIDTQLVSVSNIIDSAGAAMVASDEQEIIGILSINFCALPALLIRNHPWIPAGS